MGFTNGKVHEYSPGRDQSLEPLLEGLIKAGTYIDEAVFVLRSNDPDKSIIMPYEDMKNEKIMVTKHMMERPKSGHGRVVKVITAPKRFGKIWSEFEQQPADEFYRKVTTLDTKTVINNLVNMTPKAMLYCISSSHDKLVNKIQFNNIYRVIHVNQAHFHFIFFLVKC
jgi:hypothetical protein